MSPLTTTLLISFGVIMGTMTILWLVSLKLRDASIVDPFWGAGFVIVAWVAYSLNATASLRAIVLNILVTLWGLRLTLYLLRRNLGHGEDRRYRAMRAHYSERFWWVSLITVFWLQAAILWIVSLPIQAVAAGSSSSPWGVLDSCGTAFWCVGLFFESVGDWQLARFKANPKNAGRVMNRGLWRYTRHPNYFGDFCVWWGVYLVAVSAGAWWTAFAPALMSLFLLKVSGVTLLERTIVDRRPEYAAYQAETNAFFPGPPRRT